ncbi:proteoglycan 4-like [Salvelinus sp. IW2-2015]|uniref:proteoglycan 4-like n=1 Tax=Salvelinus sp. IW2-2015 TaxID=2691554 RepID=UPI000CEB3747|nr:acidic proline-rich protein PRP25-like [Salvelinus alpinus]
MAHGKKPGKITRILGPSPSSCPGGSIEKKPGTIRRILAPSSPPSPGPTGSTEESNEGPHDEGPQKERPQSLRSKGPPPCPDPLSTGEPTDEEPWGLSSKGPTERLHDGTQSLKSEGPPQHSQSTSNEELDNNNDERTPGPAAPVSPTHARPSQAYSKITQAQNYPLQSDAQAQNYPQHNKPRIPR